MSQLPLQYIQILLHFLMTDFSKAISFYQRKFFIPFLLLIWWQRMRNQNVKSCDEAQNSQRLCCFSRKILDLRENEPCNPLIFSITRILVLCSTFWVILIKIYGSIFEKNFNRHYKMARNYKTDSYTMTLTGEIIWIQVFQLL